MVEKGGRLCRPFRPRDRWPAVVERHAVVVHPLADHFQRAEHLNPLAAPAIGQLLCGSP